MSNIVELKCKRFEYKVEVATYCDKNEGNETIFQRALIVIEDNCSHRKRVHDFSEYLLKNYSNHSIKTQIDYAGKIVAFMNFYKKKKYNGNFIDLSIYDVREFLQIIALKDAKKTFKKYSRVLTSFCYYLANKGFLNNISDSNFKDNEEVSGSYLRKYKVLIMETIDVPRKKNNKPRHNFPFILQSIFLQIAIEEVNIIALGVALQFFGGIRTGEIVNISRTSYESIGPYGRYGLDIMLEDRYFRMDLSQNSGKGYVKKQRPQIVLSPNSILEPLLKNHLLKYKCTDGSNALFINKQGKAMSYANYLYYFSKIKEKFILRLSQSKDPRLKVAACDLIESKWFSHIGRGIFTNNLKASGITLSQLQTARGDSSILSSGTYTETVEDLSKKMEDASEGAFKNILLKGDND